MASGGWDELYNRGPLGDQGRIGRGGRTAQGHGRGRDDRRRQFPGQGNEGKSRVRGGREYSGREQDRDCSPEQSGFEAGGGEQHRNIPSRRRSQSESGAQRLQGQSFETPQGHGGRYQFDGTHRQDPDARGAMQQAAGPVPQADYGGARPRTHLQQTAGTTQKADDGGTRTRTPMQQTAGSTQQADDRGARPKTHMAQIHHGGARQRSPTPAPARSQSPSLHTGSRPRPSPIPQEKYGGHLQRSSQQTELRGRLRTFSLPAVSSPYFDASQIDKISRKSPLPVQFLYEGKPDHLHVPDFYGMLSSPSRPRTTGPLTDLEEDLSTVKLQTCSEDFDDPTEALYDRAFSRTPVHHRNSWHLDRLAIASSTSSTDPRQLPELENCYRDSHGAYECQVHRRGDENSACWLLHPSYLFYHFVPRGIEGKDEVLAKRFMDNRLKERKSAILRRLKKGKDLGEPGKPFIRTKLEPIPLTYDDEEDEEEDEECP